jgi:hypothetical protein
MTWFYIFKTSNNRFFVSMKCLATSKCAMEFNLAMFGPPKKLGNLKIFYRFYYWQTSFLRWDSSHMTCVKIEPLNYPLQHLNLILHNEIAHMSHINITKKKTKQSNYVCFLKLTYGVIKPPKLPITTQAICKTQTTNIHIMTITKHFWT